MHTEVQRIWEVSKKTKDKQSLYQNVVITISLAKERFPQKYLEVDTRGYHRFEVSSFKTVYVKAYFWRYKELKKPF